MPHNTQRFAGTARHRSAGRHRRGVSFTDALRDSRDLRPCGIPGVSGRVGDRQRCAVWGAFVPDVVVAEGAAMRAHSSWVIVGPGWCRQDRPSVLVRETRRVRLAVSSAAVVGADKAVMARLPAALRGDVVSDWRRRRYRTRCAGRCSLSSVSDRFFRMECNGTVTPDVSERDAAPAFVGTELWDCGRRRCEICVEQPNIGTGICAAVMSDVCRALNPARIRRDRSGSRSESLRSDPAPRSWRSLTFRGASRRPC
jgi:hypothetical protein